MAAGYFGAAAQLQLTSSIFQPSLHVVAEPVMRWVSEADTKKRASCFTLLVALPDAFSQVSVQTSAHESRLSHVFCTSKARPVPSSALWMLTHASADSAACAEPAAPTTITSAATPTRTNGNARRMPHRQRSRSESSHDGAVATFGSGGGRLGGGETVKIEAQFEVGEYETLILNAVTVRQGPTEVKGSMQGAEARRLGRRMA